MQLIIDVGNTKVKLAIFDTNQLIEVLKIDLDELLVGIETLALKYPIRKAIISSVAKLSEIQKRSIKSRFPTLELNHKTPVPFKNKYKTPHTLGVDRIALVTAFAKAYPATSGLIIDAGTCVTYDFIQADGVYLGGAISPGLRLRYQSLNQLTANLPLLETEEPDYLIGTTTNEAIHAGVVNGLTQEIEGTIGVYKDNYPDLKVILTGGDAEILSKRLKNSIFAHSNFLLEGLNHILRYADD